MLGRGHALFGDPPASGGTAAATSGAGLSAAGDMVRGGHQRISALSGALPAGYSNFATDAGPALDAAAKADDALGTNLRDAAAADRSGRGTSGAVVNGAASDTAALAPSTQTPAGQRALVSALRARLAQQRHFADVPVRQVRGLHCFLPGHRVSDGGAESVPGVGA